MRVTYHMNFAQTFNVLSSASPNRSFHSPDASTTSHPRVPLSFHSRLSNLKSFAHILRKSAPRPPHSCGVHLLRQMHDRLKVHVLLLLVDLLLISTCTFSPQRLPLASFCTAAGAVVVLFAAVSSFLALEPPPNMLKTLSLGCCCRFGGLLCQGFASVGGGSWCRPFFFF